MKQKLLIHFLIVFYFQVPFETQHNSPLACEKNEDSLKLSKHTEALLCQGLDS